MTNEELVTAIQQGDSEKMMLLWQQVEKLVTWKANRVLSALGSNSCVEFGDLYNSGYIALCRAVKQYDPDRSDGFICLFMLCLKTAFAEATGYRSARQQNDPLHNAYSFDEIVPGAEDTTLGDLISDGKDYEAEVIERIWERERHDALEKALNALPDAEELALRLQYYEDLDITQSAEFMSLRPTEVTALRRKALAHIRRPEITKTLEQYVDSISNFFLRTSVKSQQSLVELIVERREEIRNRCMSRIALDRERKFARH